MKELLQKLIESLRKVVELLLKKKELIEKETEAPSTVKDVASKLLLKAAEESLGIDVTPQDKVDDEFACVTSVVAILNKVIYFPFMSYTPYFVRELKRDSRFKSVLDIKEGDIIVNATGSGNGSMRGHTGIVGRDGDIFSNNSYNGKWEKSYTLDTWKQRYRIKGGMPTMVFRLTV